MKIPQHRSTYISIFVVLLWLTLLLLWFNYFFSNELNLEKTIFWMQDYIRENIFLWVCIFVAAYIVRPLFFIPATPFDLFSGMVFWPFFGFIVSSISTFFSAKFSYWVGYLTWWIVLEKKNIKKFEKLQSKLAENTFQTTFMMRLIMLPFDLSNYICWVLQAPYIKYLFGTWIWVLPATAVFVGAGAAFYGKDINTFDALLENVNYSYLMLSSGFFISIIILSRILKKRYKDINL